MGHMTKSKNLSPSVALAAAETFLRYSRQFIDTLPKDQKQAANIAVRNIGGLVASATTLSLATELHLKSLLMFFTTDIPESHDLWGIFKRLPIDVMEGIEKEFDERYASFPKDEHLALNLIILPLKQPKNPLVDSPAPGRDDVKSILKRSRNAFILWRYLYEKGEDWRHFSITYECGGLGLLCEIIGRMVREGLSHGKITLSD